MEREIGSRGMKWGVDLKIIIIIIIIKIKT